MRDAEMRELSIKERRARKDRLLSSTFYLLLSIFAVFFRSHRKRELGSLMQICSSCKTKQLDGTIFCGECGASLLSPTRSETTMSLGQRGPAEEYSQPARVASPAPATASGPQIALVLMNSGRRISLDISDDLLIGRKDNARGIFPDVDLGMYGGFDAGVSRRHAILAHANGVYTVEDLASANGTFVNGQPVAAAAPARLRNGDELKCGTLLMRVEIAG